MPDPISPFPVMKRSAKTLWGVKTWFATRNQDLQAERKFWHPTGTQVLAPHRLEPVAARKY
jgi:hypothetical protein